MPVDLISRATIATIGQPLDGDRHGVVASDGDEGLQADPGRDRTTAGRVGPGEGPGPRPAKSHRASTAAPSHSVPTDPVWSGDSLAIGQLRVAHSVHGAGQVAFGIPAFPDHLAIRFENGDQRILHKSDLTLVSADRGGANG
jgi:hypothetical protein